ncbi:benzoate 1,2-dioxygenase electron transfer component BenC [Roseivivax sp. THAF197b]|uniref:benzoate 1,2-dioxygenase electron transfer component BenC n=1 Tax=Roseivivax sp. THAF197b TaxID=2588299 RepID=UPI00126950D4|nr:benzoate 1,2-dioxygenase electron transfer component BenC [Roseivivax sp. THAF197b]QFS85042.1 Benzoate 1,2-dioxygenase electron transfer component [Roseivivax sp. THAF197b]
MTYQVVLNFEDGVSRVISCDDAEKVTDAAFRHKINLPMDCRDGVCGTCKCKVGAGDYEMEFYLEDEAMTEEEEQEGYALLCQTTVSSDAVFNVMASSEACKTGAQQTAGEVIAAEKLSETSFNLRVKLEKPLGFLPGQYVNVSVPGTEETRSYSFSSKPGTDEATFLIRNLEGGVMSSYLAERASAGDKVELTGPMGIFYLREMKRPQLWLAGGTGLAPFLSMLEKVAEEGTDQPITLYYAVTRAADLVELERVEQLAEKIGTVTVVTILAAEDEEHALKGYVTDHLSEKDMNDGDVDVYLCGPPPMVDAVSKHFKTLGTEPAQFFYEKFNPSESKAEAA